MSPRDDVAFGKTICGQCQVRPVRLLSDRDELGNRKEGRHCSNRCAGRAFRARNPDYDRVWKADRRAQEVAQ